MTPEQYIEALEEPRRGEIRELHELIRETVPDLEPHIAYGMLGYGPFNYRYASGRCVRFKRTADADRDALRELIAEAGRIGPAAEA